jgi:ankyrin repeat protein
MSDEIIREPLIIPFPEIIKASFEGNLIKIKHLMNTGSDIHEKNIYDWNCIAAASHNGLFDVVEFLISMGCDINNQDEDGLCPIYRAVNNNHIAVVELLILHGANIDKMSIDLAGSYNYIEIIDLLLVNGTNIKEDHNYAVRVNKHICKWPITMAILVWKELGIYYHFDAESLIDLYQYHNKC